VKIANAAELANDSGEGEAQLVRLVAGDCSVGITAGLGGADYYSDEESEALATEELPNLQPILKQASEVAPCCRGCPLALLNVPLGFPTLQLQDADGQLARALLELEARAPADLEPLVQAANDAVGYRCLRLPYLSSSPSPPLSHTACICAGTCALIGISPWCPGATAAQAPQPSVPHAHVSGHATRQALGPTLPDQ
jgi:hypothetical protein